MSAPPYMAVYVADYTADVQHLTCEQDGAYWRLLRAMWRAGGRLPYKPEKLATICGLTEQKWREIGPDVIDLFQVRGGLLTHKRITLEIFKFEAKILASSRGGKSTHSKKVNENKGNGDDSLAKNEVVNGVVKGHQPELELNKRKKDSLRSPKKEILDSAEGSEFSAEAEPSTPPIQPPPTALPTRLSPDWEPSEADLSYALKNQIDGAALDRMVDDFRDYWCSTAGPNAMKMDWGRTWQRWVRTTSDRMTPPKPKRVGFV